MSYELIHGDCLDILPTLEAGSVDCIICDPPYGTTACKWDAVIPFAPMWASIKHVIKRNAAVVLFGSQPFTSALVMSNPKWFKYAWVWDRGQVSNPQLAKIQPLKTTEEICVFGAGRVLYNPQGLSTDTAKVISRRGDWQKTLDAKRRLGHIKIAQEYTQTYTNYPKLLVRFPKGRDNIVHPSQKPVALLEYLIRTYTNEGETVLDFTMGSGSTGVAALNTGRRFIGIERDETYFAIAQERLEAASQQLRMAV